MYVYIKNGSIIYKGPEQYQNGVVFEYDTVIHTVYNEEDSIIYEDGVVKLYEPPIIEEKIEYIPLSFEEERTQQRDKRVKATTQANNEFEKIRDANVALFITSQYA